MTPEDYIEFLKTVNWLQYNDVFEAQSIAGEDPTLVNIYSEASKVALAEIEKVDPH